MAKRRGKGEGSVFQLSDGRWAAEVDLGYQDGKRKRKRLSATTQAEVLKKKAELLRQIAEGLPVSDDRLTVEKYLTEWLETVKRTRSHNTYLLRKRCVHHDLIPAFGKTKLKKLAVKQVRDLLFKMADKGLGIHHITSVKATIRTALRDAMRDGKILRNVAALTEMPLNAKQPGEKRGLTPDEATELLDALDGYRFEVPVKLMLSLGLRRGEAFALRPEDIDFDAGKLHIRGNLQFVEGKWTVIKPKTKSSEASLPLPSGLARLLRRHLAEQALLKRLAGDKWNEQGFLFTTENGNPVPEASFSKSFRAFQEERGLSRLRPHELRHSCGTILFVQGVEMKVIQAILRHSRLATTMDVYTHLIEGMTEDALSGMDAIIDRSERRKKAIG
jgi:integrase